MSQRLPLPMWADAFRACSKAEITGSIHFLYTLGFLTCTDIYKCNLLSTLKLPFPSQAVVQPGLVSSKRAEVVWRNPGSKNQTKPNEQTKPPAFSFPHVENVPLSPQSTRQHL